jgi:hypothetical protein
LNTSNNDNKNRWLSLTGALFVATVALLGLQACGGGGTDPAPVVNANPAGYYSSGDATVKDPANAANNLIISDLQGMVNGARFMMMSLSNALMYDGTITSIVGNDFTADVVIYVNMAIADGVTPDPVINTTIKGTITEGSKITGTIAGTGVGSGDFSLTFSQSNSTQAELVNIVKRWGGDINIVLQGTSFELVVKNTGDIEVEAFRSATAGLFKQCEMTGTIAPVSNSALYTLDLNLTAGTCNAGVTREGNYTGLVTTISKINTNDTLVVMFNNGAVAGMAEWGICSSVSSATCQQ